MAHKTILLSEARQQAFHRGTSAKNAEITAASVAFWRWRVGNREDEKRGEGHAAHSGCCHDPEKSRDATHLDIRAWRDGDRHWRNYRKAAAPQAGCSGGP